MYTTTKKALTALGAGAILAATLAAPALAAPVSPAPTAVSGAPAPAPKPPLGWNSWNTFHCNVSDQLIRQTADAMVSSGMKAAGYEYVVIDDCWSDGRNADGTIKPNAQRFPDMKALGDYIHSKGLKFGIYAAPGTSTCAQYVGSAGHEAQDAATFASWGVDYLKYDWCWAPMSVDDSLQGAARRTAILEEQKRIFAVMRDALAATGRPIFYSINPNSGFDQVDPLTGQTWADIVKPGLTEDYRGIANMVRTTEDIKAVWDSGRYYNQYQQGVVNIIDLQEKPGIADRQGPGYWNDPDMLEVGVYNADGWAGMNDTEAQAHMSLWAIMASPLIAGNDIRSMSQNIQRILTDRDVVGVNQDALGKQGRRVLDDGDREVWAKPLADGRVAVVLLNRSGSTQDVTATPQSLGLSGSSFTIQDLWLDCPAYSSTSISATVPSHGAAMYIVSGASGAPAQQDCVDFGNVASEQAHGVLAHPASGINDEAGSTRRYANISVPGAWFSADLKVEPGKPFVLRGVDTFSAPGIRRYQVYVNDVLVGTNVVEAGAVGSQSWQMFVHDPQLLAQNSGTARVKLVYPTNPQGMGDPSLTSLSVVTPDRVDFGDAASETAHGVTAAPASGTNVEAGLTRRYANVGVPGSWFAASLAVTPGQPFAISGIETFSWPTTRKYDVYIDGTKVAQNIVTRSDAGAGSTRWTLALESPEAIAAAADGSVVVKFVYPNPRIADDPSIADLWAYSLK